VERVVTVRHVLIALNLVAVVAIIVYLVWAVLSPKRAPTETLPANLTPFLADEDLESRRLERVQGWALLFAAVIAVALPLYWLHEPSRQKEAVNYFNANAVHRGEVLFSNSSMPDYDPTQSLQCANCHGADGTGGPVPTVVNGKSVIWQAPPLNTVFSRFEEDPACSMPVDDQPGGTICDITNIITYGRPGTPMQPWGVEGGGAKNDQSIQDLVAYLRTIQLKPAQIKAQEAGIVTAARSSNPKVACPQYTSCPLIAEAQAKATLQTDSKTLATQRTGLQKALGSTADPDSKLNTMCTTLQDEVTKDSDKPNSVKVNQKVALACGTFLPAYAAVQNDQATVKWTETWAKRRVNVSDGQLLFEANCARCHTAGWSTFNPAIPPSQPGGLDFVGLPGGGGGTGGGIGFNLRDNDTIRRFGTDISGGFDAQVQFVMLGSKPFQAYGNLGIGSGRMPGFANMLTPAQIDEIVSYERYCLDTSTFTKVEPACSTSAPYYREPATTTTAVKG
jgi:mono/diheme cytochrome c family protein